jgi:hypothetical protein
MLVTALQHSSFILILKRTNLVANDPGSISQSISGGNVYGGMQAVQGNNNQQTQDTNTVVFPQKIITQAEVIQLLIQIEGIIHASELPVDVKEDITLYLRTAKKAAEKEEPKKDVAVVNLKSMAETIETTSKTVESGKKIWENIKPILVQIAPWLGVAKSFFGF